jgi:hypothetical protein
MHDFSCDKIIDDDISNFISGTLSLYHVPYQKVPLLSPKSLSPGILSRTSGVADAYAYAKIRSSDPLGR